jgi:hypothetical protein
MVMPARFSRSLNHPQRTGHPEMHQQIAGSGLKKQVFTATLNRDNVLACQRRPQVVRNRPTQARIAHNDALNLASYTVGFNAPAGCFNFRQLGHSDDISVLLSGKKPKPKQKTPAMAGVSCEVLVGRGRLLDLAFLVHDVFAHHGIVLFHFQLVRRGPLVFIRSIEVACTGGGIHSDLVSHCNSPLDLFAASANV